MTERLLVVAIHDVTPAHAERLERVFEFLTRVGVERPALLVVPNWHGEWPLDAHPQFAADLCRRQARGAEIFLHGYRHDEMGHRRTFGDRFRVFGRTARSAEFMFLSEQETRERLDQGLAALGQTGLEPVGFVPPAWLFGPHTRATVRERELPLTESFVWLEDLAAGRRVFAPALSWSTARTWRSHVSAALSGARTRAAWTQSVMRVSIHPPDIDVPAARRSMEACVERLLMGRRLVTYREVFGRESATS